VSLIGRASRLAEARKYSEVLIVSVKDGRDRECRNMTIATGDCRLTQTMAKRRFDLGDEMNWKNRKRTCFWVFLGVGRATGEVAACKRFSSIRNITRLTAYQSIAVMCRREH
jgi:hypothetical protein